ncbi:hypothetical protein [Arthrobacter sp. RCC_34]
MPNWLLASGRGGEDGQACTTAPGNANGAAHLTVSGAVVVG